MLNKKELKAQMVRNGFTNEKLAKALNISPRTLTSRFQTGDFGSEEIAIIMRVLHIDNPVPIFFAE